MRVEAFDVRGHEDDAMHRGIADLAGYRGRAARGRAKNHPGIVEGADRDARLDPAMLELRQRNEEAFGLGDAQPLSGARA